MHFDVLIILIGFAVTAGVGISIALIIKSRGKAKSLQKPHNHHKGALVSQEEAANVKYMMFENYRKKIYLDFIEMEESVLFSGISLAKDFNKTFVEKLINKYGITKEQLIAIKNEGRRNHWSFKAVPEIRKEQKSEKDLDNRIQMSRTMQFMEVPRPLGEGRCSDIDCPCGFEGVVIPKGKGYVYISKEVVEFRRDCLTLIELQRKIQRISLQKGANIPSLLLISKPILMCEQGARKRRLNMEIAAEDARYWWNTGLVPLRPTPLTPEIAKGPPDLKTHRLQCSFCGKGLIPPRFGLMSSEEANAMVQKTGYYCDQCNKVACCNCSFMAARAQGKNYFICPSCGKDIRESHAQEDQIKTPAPNKCSNKPAINYEQSQREEVIQGNKTLLRERSTELPSSEVAKQDTDTVVRQDIDRPTLIKPERAKEETLAKGEQSLLKGEQTLLKKRTPELTSLEMAGQGDWAAKKVRVWQKGDLILDTYKVEDIKMGGMGYVYIAKHQGWKVKIAIKSPNEMMLSNRSLFSRVLREADAWTGLGLHPHIAYCYYVRKIEDVPHIFIEYVDGGNLREWISDVRCYDLKVGLDIAIQFCHGMEHAHSTGMIHRDIKPENILMTKDGTVKVTDFGIARGKGDEEKKLGLDGEGKRDGDVGKREDNLTTIGTRMGTYDYMAPEQYEDAHSVDKRADIYSFGVCLYEMFCGRKPYGTASQVAASVIAKEEKKQAHEPSSLRDDLPVDLALLLKKCCHLERDGRYSLFEEIRKELMRIYHDLFHEAPPHGEIELIESKADVLNNRAISYLDLGREEEAVRCWQEALREDPQHLEATFNYGYFRWQRGEILSDVYVTQMKELEESKGTESDYWRLLAWIHLERGDIEEVERIKGSGQWIEDEAFLKAYHYRPIGRLICTFEGHTGQVNTVSFSPDGRYALSGNWDDNAIIWDIKSGRKIKRFKRAGVAIFSISFSPDSRYALSGSSGSWDKTIRLWDIETGRNIKKFEGHNDDALAVSFSPDGRYALSGSMDYTIKLWDIESGKEIRQFEGHTNMVSSVSFSPDGRYALSGSWDKTIRYWEMYYPLRDWSLMHPYPLLSKIKDIKNIIMERDRVETLMKSAIDNMKGGGYHEGYILLVKARNIRGYEKDSKILALQNICGCEGKGKRKGLKDAWCHIFEGHIGRVNSVSFSPDGHYALSGGMDEYTIRLWDIESRRELRKFEGLNGGILSVSFSPDGRYALSGNKNDTISLWDIESGKEIRRFVGHTGWVLSVSFSPDGRYALSGGWDKTVRLWDIERGKEIRKFEGHKKRVDSVSFSPDGRYVLDSTARLWDIESGREIKKFEIPTMSVCFSADGQHALLGSYGSVLLWEIERGRELKKFLGHTGLVSSVSFSPDGRYALSGSWDNTIRLWDIETGREIKKFEGHTRSITSVSFSPDGRYALSGSQDKTVRLWELDWDWEFPNSKN